MTCFNGGCTGAQKHALRHHTVSSHPIVLNIRKAEKPKPKADATAPAPAQAAPAPAAADADAVVIST